jgi:hypothetical protein
MRNFVHGTSTLHCVARADVPIYFNIRAGHRRLKLHGTKQLHRYQVKPHYIDLNINIKLYDYIEL